MKATVERWRYECIPYSGTDSFMDNCKAGGLS